jgi:hypothetical protein
MGPNIKLYFSHLYTTRILLTSRCGFQMPRHNLLLLLVVLCIAFVHADDVISLPTRCLGRATVRIHYQQHSTTSNNDACRSTLILVGVGTAMNANSYDALGVAVASQVPHAIVAIVNPTRSVIKLNPITLDARPFANAVNRVVSRLLESSSSTRRIRDPSLLPADVKLCPLNATTTTSSSQPAAPLRILVGGHSASGAAAFYALDQLYDFDVSGYLSLDPFPIRPDPSRTVPSLPTLAWGFAATTCKVTVSEAAVAAYEHALPNRRVLYQVQNSVPGGSSSSSCILSHCLFTDGGCPFCGNACNATANRDAIADVGLSVRLFVETLAATSAFSKQTFDSRDLSLARSLYRIYPFDNASRRIDAVGPGVGETTSRKADLANV